MKVIGLFVLGLISSCVGAPLIVTEPGAYEGGTYDTVRIKTAGAVWLNRVAFTQGVSGEVGDTSGVGVRPNVRFTNCTFSGPPARYGFANWSLASLEMSHCSFTTQGVVVMDGGAPIVIAKWNRVRDISGATGPVTCKKVSWLQLDKIHSGGIDIGMNECINGPGSAIEDVISFAQSGGLVASRAQVHDNFVRGQFAYPRNHNSSGSGIMCFDPAGGSGLLLRGYTDCVNNYVCDVQNAGIDAAGSGFITITGNVVVNCGTGPRTWNWESKTAAAAYGPFTVSGNKSNTFSLAKGVTAASGNVPVGGMTSEELQGLWAAKVRVGGWTIGPVPAAAAVNGIGWFAASPGVQNVPLSKENLGPATGVGYTVAGSWVRYPEVDFGVHGVKTISLIAATPLGASIAVQADGIVVATVKVPATGGWYKWATVTVTVPPTLVGSHWITLSFGGSANVQTIIFR